MNETGLRSSPHNMRGAHARLQVLRCLVASAAVRTRKGHEEADRITFTTFSTVLLRPRTIYNRDFSLEALGSETRSRSPAFYRSTVLFNPACETARRARGPQV